MKVQTQINRAKKGKMVRLIDAPQKEKRDNKMKKISQEEFTFQEMKKVFENLHLPVGLERHDGGWNISSGLHHPEGPYKEIVMASYAPKIQLTNINSLLVSPPIPQNKLADVLELLNSINLLLVSTFMRYRPDMLAIDLSAGMFIPYGKFDRVQFTRLLDHVVDVGHRFYPILLDFLGGKTSKPEALHLIDFAWPRPAAEKN
jgi:hypothetical protein